MKSFKFLNYHHHLIIISLLNLGLPNEKACLKLKMAEDALITSSRSSLETSTALK